LKRKFVWIGAGVFFVIAVGSGFIPDLRLDFELRNAKQSGLTLLERPDVQPKAGDNAAVAYGQAISKFGPIPNYLASDFAGQIKANNPQTRRYIQAMSEASKRPAFVPVVDNSGTDDGFHVPIGATLFNASRAAVAFAVNADQLEPPARMAKHLGDRGSALEVGQWAYVVNAIFNRAKVLHLSAEDQSRLAALLGPPPSARQALHDHVARKILKMEAAAKKDGRGVARVRDEVAYLQFWREFFAENSSNRPLAPAIRAKENLIQEAENRNGEFMDFQGLFGSSVNPWTDWAGLVDGASQRLAAAR
jgi:hypothetical protein